jgi:hypothetical protein
VATLCWVVLETNEFALIVELIPSMKP